MERQELENSREFKAAKELEHALNDYGWNNKRFASAVTTFHRTLQQINYCDNLLFYNKK